MAIARHESAHVEEAAETAARAALRIELSVGQNRVLELIARGVPLARTLHALATFLEELLPNTRCSVLLLDGDGVHLRHGSAPSLPTEYSRAIDGAAIGPNAGSCGTAAYLGKQVVVSDIESDALWTDYRDLARRFGLRACWSTPIFDAANRVLGTFALYFDEPRSPTALHQDAIGIATHVAAIAIESDRRQRVINESQERYRLLNLATNDAVWDWDVKANTLWWNENVERLFGYAPDEVPSDYGWWVERVHPDDRQRVHESLQVAADSSATSWHEDYRFRRKDGSYADILDRGYVMRDDAGATIRMIGTMQDISERKQAALRIEQLAYFEPVTGLPNRAAMQRDLARVIAGLQGGQQELALLLLNLNYFRDVNNSVGHQYGDLALLGVATRLRGAIGNSGSVASLGGDEFAILLPRVRSQADIDSALSAVHDSLQTPIDLSSIPIKLEATIGVARCPLDASEPATLWRRADVALRTAKERHAPHFYYQTAVDHYDPTRLELISDLRTAIAADQLLLHFQPKIDLQTGRTVALEALVRWQHPVRGMVFPDTFIPLAERTGLINPLTHWVVVAALRQAAELAKVGLPLDLSVNLSTRNLHDPRFCDRLLEQVDAAEFPLSRLTLEITETAIMADPLRAKEALARLHRAGIHLSMDDFGIGQSSLTYLKDLPITKMKIDKSFVIGFDQPHNVAIVRSAIDLARNMNLSVTAEGIEDEATYRALRELRCDLGQGYFFSRPLPIEPLTTWLHESRWSAGCLAAE
jgi:diguanylate cyclase (GGDEF)-like protein/PAS domain S-box-containing protein